MSTPHSSLDAASTDRKARLAKLASLKRKQPGSNTTISTQQDQGTDSIELSKSDVYLSGRNYDIQMKGPRTGFENAPAADVDTLEQQADRIATSAAEQAAKDEAEAEKGIDLFKLQPKKPNWDLKRDLAEKMKVVDVRTQNAIARLVRERIEKAKVEALRQSEGRVTSSTEERGEEVGIEGSALVEGVHLREREDEEEEKREKQSEEDDEDVS